MEVINKVKGFVKKPWETTIKELPKIEGTLHGVLIGTAIGGIPGGIIGGVLADRAQNVSVGGVTSPSSQFSTEGWKVGLKSRDFNLYLRTDGESCNAVGHRQGYEGFALEYVRPVRLESAPDLEAYLVSIRSLAFGKLLVCSPDGQLRLNTGCDGRVEAYWLLVQDPPTEGGYFIRSAAFQDFNLMCSPGGEVKTSTNAQAWEVWVVEFI